MHPSRSHHLPTHRPELLWTCVLADAVTHLSWSPSGRSLAVGVADGTVHLLAETGREVTRHTTSSTVSITAMRWDPSSPLTVGRTDGVVVVGANETRRALTHRGEVTDLAWHPPSGHLAVATSHDLAIYDRRLNREAEHCFQAQPLAKVAWLSGPRPASHSLAVSQNETLSWYPDAPGIDSRRHHAMPGRTRSMAPDPSGRYLAVGDFTGVLRIFDPQLDGVTEICGYDGRIDHVSWAPTGTHLAAASSADLTLCSASDTSDSPESADGGETTVPRSLVAHEAPISALSHAPITRTSASALLASADLDGMVMLWNPASRQLLRAIKLRAGVLALAWHPAKPLVSVGLIDGRVLTMTAPPAARPAPDPTRCMHRPPRPFPNPR